MAEEHKAGECHACCCCGCPWFAWRVCVAVVVRCVHVMWRGRNVMGAADSADTWPSWFREDGYAGLMRQLQARGISYAYVHQSVCYIRDAKGFESFLTFAAGRERAQVNDDDIPRLFQLCKETPPGKHTQRGCSGCGVSSTSASPTRVAPCMCDPPIGEPDTRQG